MDIYQLSQQIKDRACRLGFDLCRLVPVSEAPHADFFERWLGAGRAGEMTYLARYVDKRRRPVLLTEEGPDLRSLIVLGVDYHQFDLPEEWRIDPSRGIIASYAWGDDYHEIIRPLLYELDEFVRKQSGRTTLGKALVDTGPVLERDWAQRAGIGFTGKNCCTIHPERGSWIFLATLMVPEELHYDAGPRPAGVTELSTDAIAEGLPPANDYGRWTIPLDGGHRKSATCGRCTRCMDACPTDAFVGPYHLDPGRCISYWTIEASDPVPRHLRPLFGNRIFGCDICQEVCPWNRHLPERTPLLAGLAAQVGRIAPPLLEGFQPETPYWLQQEAFSRRFRRSPVKRAKRKGMLRNVCTALGNWASVEAIPALALALNDEEALARGHAAWALGRIWQESRHADAKAFLVERRKIEGDDWVREELSHALAAVRTGLAG